MIKLEFHQLKKYYCTSHNNQRPPFFKEVPVLKGSKKKPTKPFIPFFLKHQPTPCKPPCTRGP